MITAGIKKTAKKKHFLQKIKRTNNIIIIQHFKKSHMNMVPDNHICHRFAWEPASCILAFNRPGKRISSELLSFKCDKMWILYISQASHAVKTLFLWCFLTKRNDVQTQQIFADHLDLFYTIQGETVTRFSKETQCMYGTKVLFH